MPGYLIANYTVTDEQGFAPYPPAVGPILAAHGGEPLVITPAAEVQEGEPAQMLVVLRFPSLEAAHGFYESDEYRQIIHHRTDNSHGWLVLADGVPD